MVVFGGDENVGVECGNFFAPPLCMGFAVLMHDWGYRFIEEWQFVVLDIDNFKLRVVAVFQKVVHPLCDSCSLPSRSRTADDDSNLYHLLFLHSGAVPWRTTVTHSVIMVVAPTC